MDLFEASEVRIIVIRLDISLPVSKMLMIYSVNFVSLALITMLAEMLAKIRSLFDHLFEVEVDIRWQGSNLLNLIAKEISQCNKLLDRERFLALVFVRPILGHPGHDGSITFS